MVYIEERPHGSSVVIRLSDEEVIAGGVVGGIFGAVIGGKVGYDQGYRSGYAEGHRIGVAQGAAEKDAELQPIIQGLRIQLEEERKSKLRLNVSQLIKRALP